MGRPRVYYAELNLSGGRIIMRLQDELRRGMNWWSPHRHASVDYELHILAEGHSVLHLNNSDHPVTEGQGVLIPPQAIHFSETYSKVMKHLYIHFQVKGQSLKDTMRSAVGDCRIFPVEESTIVMVRQLLQTLCSDEFYRQELLESLLRCVMLRALSDAGVHVGGIVTEVLDEDQERKNIIDVYFQPDMPYGNKEERLARELGISRRQLARVLQKYYGMNFRELMLHKRMEHAAWMLSRTNDPVAKIAETMNYTSVSAFSQAFRAIYEKTPTQYRKEHKDRKTTMEP